MTTDASKLDLVLRIFVESELVFLLPEIPADRYQLVHDYLESIEVSSEMKIKALGKLGQTVYSVKECNRFYGHSGAVNSVSFSPIWMALL